MAYWVDWLDAQQPPVASRPRFKNRGFTVPFVPVLFCDAFPTNPPARLPERHQDGNGRSILLVAVDSLNE